MPSGNPNNPYNPHASASGAYGANAQKNASDPREVEARVLLKSAQFMSDLQKNWDTKTPEILEETLKYNRNIWMMFYDTAIESQENGANTRPKELANNIFSLANFVFKRELEIMATPDQSKFDVLININRQIAAGLMEGVKNNPIAVTSDDAIKNPPEGGNTNQSA